MTSPSHLQGNLMWQMTGMVEAWSTTPHLCRQTLYAVVSFVCYIPGTYLILIVHVQNSWMRMSPKCPSPEFHVPHLIYDFKIMHLSYDLWLWLWGWLDIICTTCYSMTELRIETLSFESRVTITLTKLLFSLIMVGGKLAWSEMWQVDRRKS
jgi:hypothetical protein